MGTSNLQLLSGKKLCRFSLATERAYKDAMGEAKIETTWHNVSAWEGGRNIPDLELIRKGSRLEVLGRIRNTRAESSDGSIRIYTDIQAGSLKILGEQEPLSIDM